MRNEKQKLSGLKKGLQERVVWGYSIEKSIYNSAQQRNATVKRVAVITGLPCCTSPRFVSLVSYLQSNKKCEIVVISIKREFLKSQISTRKTFLLQNLVPAKCKNFPTRKNKPPKIFRVTEQSKMSNLTDQLTHRVIYLHW